MYTVKQPNRIIFGRNSAKTYDFPDDCLVVTSSGAKSRGWLDDYTPLGHNPVFDGVESNPAMGTVDKIVSEFGGQKFDAVVGIGGGSSLDVAKYCAYKMNKPKIMVPTTFGSGSEVTRICVLKIDGKKKSFHDDCLFADVAIVDSAFLDSSDTKQDVVKNSAIDACAQCTEAYDSKLANPYTKFFCENAFVRLEDGILCGNKENLALGSLFSGLGFGNSSTTLGHGLSYVYSNEGFSHGHALAFTTTVSHKFNGSVFHKRFLRLVKKLNFDPISLKQDLDDAADLILTDKKHLDPNPRHVTKNDVVGLLRTVDSGGALDFDFFVVGV